LQALRKHAGRRFVIAVPYLWLTVLFLIPFIIVFKISFSESRMAMPPYAPLIEWRDGVIVGIKLYF
jgi:putrescine transport system permease protein